MKLRPRLSARPPPSKVRRVKPVMIDAPKVDAYFELVAELAGLVDAGRGDSDDALDARERLEGLYTELVPHGRYPTRTTRTTGPSGMKLRPPLPRRRYHAYNKALARTPAAEERYFMPAGKTPEYLRYTEAAQRIGGWFRSGLPRRRPPRRRRARRG